LDTGVEKSVVELLCKIVQTQEVNEDDEKPSFKIYLKYALRCLTMCLRSRVALNILISQKVSFILLLAYIQHDS
jgi:hypothetical protein